MRHTRSHGNGTYSARPAGMRALAFIAFFIAAFGLVTIVHSNDAQATPTTAYEFANDETAAGDLDVEYRDNTDYEDDHLGAECERELINESAYGLEVYLYTCTA